MQIECKIKRAGGTKITMPNPDGSAAEYHFAPIDPTRADSPHVASVADEAHAARLLDIPEAYAPFTAGKAPKVDLPKPVAPPQAASSTVSGPEAPVAACDLPTWPALQSGIKAGTFSQEQLREWMAQEEAAESPRPGYIAAIVKALA